jgi:hypothetical protein
VRATEAQIDQIRVRCALMNCIRSAAPNGGSRKVGGVTAGDPPGR